MNLRLIHLKGLKIIVNLQLEENITVLVTDHQASNVLKITDSAMILNNGKIIAQDTPSALIKDKAVISSYLGDNFKIS